MYYLTCGLERNKELTKNFFKSMQKEQKKNFFWKIGIKKDAGLNLFKILTVNFMVYFKYILDQRFSKLKEVD